MLLLLAIGQFSFAQEMQYVGDNLIVKISEAKYDADGIDLAASRFGIEALDNLNAELGISKISQIGQHRKTRTFLLEFAHPIAVETEVNRYKNTGALDYAEPNYIAQGGGEKGESMIIPNDTRFDRQWGLYNNGTQTGIGTTIADADVDMELAWDIQTGDPNMIIAVSDSGIKMNHPDIAARIWTNPNEIPGNSIDDDANGLIDDVQGWDWRNSDNNPTDDLGHGTNCTGIIGCIANNNNLFVGANWNSKMMVLKVLGSDNSATYAAMASSIYYAVDEGAKVLSMSIGGGASSVIGDATAYTNTHNVIFVACTMNFNSNVPYYPSAYSTTYPNVIAVGATNPNDYRTAPFFWSTTSGSSYGNHVCVVAPGNYIYNLSHTSDTNAGTYWGGTSQATPLVAGIASLVLAQNPTLTPAEVRSIIQSTAQDQVGNPAEDVAGFDQYMGFGRANAQAALLATPLSTNESELALGQEFKIINPVKNNALQIFSKGNHIGNYNLNINSIDGKMMRSETINIAAGTNTIYFDYPKGSYIVTLKSDAYTKVFKVLKD